MNSFISSIWFASFAECIKVRRSKIIYASIFFSCFIPLMLGLIMFVAQHPEMAHKFGLVGTKAAVLRFGNLDWASYFGFLNQAMAGAGLLGFSFTASWIFGQEYSDRTVKDLLALPVSRYSIVISKFIVMSLWCLMLSVLFFVFAILTGKLFHITGWSPGVVLEFAPVFFEASLLSLLLSTPVAFFASFGRGYLPPIGFALFTMLLVQFVGLIGISAYYPWAIPMLLSAAGPENPAPNLTSYIILALTSFSGLAATLAWWRFADQF